jgi:Pyruvate/2-oxoacid:ferredoxin oxidoreductase delta subunit
MALRVQPGEPLNADELVFQINRHPERSSWFAKRIRYVVEGPLQSVVSSSCFKAFSPCSAPRPCHSEHGQKLWRVQVKSSRRSDGTRYIVKLKGAAAYTAKEIDFIVAYIVPEDLWYVIPISVAAFRGQMYVSPHGTRHFRHEKYREAWCQMACPRDKISPTQLLVKRQQDYPFNRCKLCNLKCPLKELRMELTRDHRGR